MEPAPYSGRLGSRGVRRGFPWVPVLLVGLLLLAVGLGVAVARQSRAEVVRLADGSTLTIDAVTFGTESVALGTGWQRLMYSLLPSPWKARAGCRVVRGLAENCLHVWASGNALNSAVAPRWAVVVDEHGNESAPCSPNSSVISTEAPAFRVSCYPRRSDQLRLRLYESGQDRSWKVLGEARIANPADTRFPLWRPPALPASAQVSTVNATLLSLERDVSLRESTFQPGPGEVIWRARVRLWRNGKPTGMFAPQLAELKDATGSVYPAQQQETRPVRPGEWEVRFTAPRWGYEQALRLGFTLTAEEEGAFLPEFAIRIPDIPAPPAEGNVAVDRKVPLYGGDITLRRMFAPGVLFPKAAVGAPLTDASRFIIDAAVDDQGRKVEIGRPRTKVWAGEPLGLQELTIPSGARSLILTIHPTTSPTVEFLAPLPPPSASR